MSAGAVYMNYTDRISENSDYYFLIKDSSFITNIANQGIGGAVVSKFWPLVFSG